MNLTPTPKEVALAERKIEGFLKRYGCGFVFGVSGGLDSAVCAKLAACATKKNFAMHLVEEGVTSSEDTHNVKSFLEELGIPHKIIDVSSLISSLKDKIACSQRAAINIRPRLLMTLLYMHANTHGCLVMGTSNRTELMLGYFTKYGDGGSDLCPIGGLYKTQVFTLANHMEIPKEFLERLPSAGLYRGQTDEGELGASYEEIDRILYSLFEEKKSVDDTARILEMEAQKVEKFRRLVKNNRHKRIPPPYPKI